jgi:hypothetical protein
MEIDFEDLEGRAAKDGFDIELFRAYIITLEKLSIADPDLIDNDEALDSTILAFYT